MKNYNSNTFCERLRFLVDELEGGKAAAFARKIGVAQPSFHNYLNGRSPNIECLYGIHEVYSVDINWLLSGDGEPFPNTFEEKGGESGPRALDTKLLSVIIRQLDTKLDERDLYLEPDKKAQVITLLYEYFLATHSDVDDEKVTDYLRLVS